jgi:hypothetical protein
VSVPIPPEELSPSARRAERARLREERDRRAMRRFSQLSILLTAAAVAFLVGGSVLRTVGDAMRQVAAR